MSRQKKIEIAAKEAAQQAEAAAPEPKVEVKVEPEAQVDTEPKEEEQPRRRGPRDHAMAELINRQKEERQQVERIEPQAEVVATPEAPKTVKVKVDGEEFEVSQTDVEEAGGVRAYQTMRAADNRLKKANETLAATRQTQEQLARFAIEKLKPSTPEVSDDDFIAEKLNAVRFGTEKEGAAALKEIMARANPKRDDTLLTNQAVVKIRQQQGADKAKEEFQDVFGSPLLARLAQNMEMERLGKLPATSLQDPVFVNTFDWANLYRSIGNEIRSALPRQSQPQPELKTQPTSQASDREARKASTIVNLPTAAARIEPPAEETPDSREQTLAKMRKARGQQG